MADVRSTPPTLPETGHIVSGKFRIEEPLGRGGLGVVMAATHLQLGQRVAIKFLDPRVLEAVDGIARFLREAQSAAKIESEHCVRILDFGTAEGGAPYIVMECLRGHDLASELRQHGALEVGRAVDYVLQASDAVAEAHAQGIIHRDLKPANLFLARREARGSLKEGAELVKVLDFGVAKVLGDGDGRMGLTGESTVIGTTYYMAPEQVRDSSRVDARTDVWALGVILFELLSGERPFNGPTASAVTAAIVADPPRSLEDLRPDVPPAVRAVIAKCLAKDPARRWPNVRAFAQALDEATAGAGSARLRLVGSWSERSSEGRVSVSSSSSSSSASEARTSSPEELAETELASDVAEDSSVPVSATKPITRRTPLSLGFVVAGVLAVGLIAGWGVRAITPSSPITVAAPDAAVPSAVTTTNPPPTTRATTSAETPPVVVTAPSATVAASTRPPSSAARPVGPPNRGPKTGPAGAPSTKGLNDPDLGYP